MEPAPICDLALAQRTSQMFSGELPLRRLSSAFRFGFQLDQISVGAALSGLRPSPPSLPRISFALGQPFGGLALLCGDLTSAGSSSFVLLVLRITTCVEPSRSPWVRRTTRLDVHRVATTHAETDGFWASVLGATLPAARALRRFTFVRDNRHTPTTSTRRALAGLLPHASVSHGFNLGLVLQALALVSSVSGSLHQGPESHLLFVHRAKRTPRKKGPAAGRRFFCGPARRPLRSAIMLSSHLAGAGLALIRTRKGNMSSCHRTATPLQMRCTEKRDGTKYHKILPSPLRIIANRAPASSDEGK